MAISASAIARSAVVAVGVILLAIATQARWTGQSALAEEAPPVAPAPSIVAGGGRRDGEKIGRSRVVDRFESGISQSGLGLSMRSGEGGWASGVWTIKTGSGIAGGAQTAEIDGTSARCGVLKSSASVGSARVTAGAPSAASARPNRHRPAATA